MFFYAGGIRFFRSLQEAKGVLVVVPRAPTTGGTAAKVVFAAAAVQNGVSNMHVSEKMVTVIPLPSVDDTVCS